MMSYTRKDSHHGAYHSVRTPSNPSSIRFSESHIYSTTGLTGSNTYDDAPRAYHRTSDTTTHPYSHFRTASTESCGRSDAPRLPSLNELFASKVLIAPGTGSPTERVPPESAGLPPLRKSSVGSSTGGSPHSASTTCSNAESYSDSESEIQRGLVIRTATACRGSRHYSPSPSAAAFGKDGNFQPIRTDSVVADVREPVYNSVWPSTAAAALYADPEFKPSGAGFTAEYKGIKSVPGFGNYHVYEGGFCIPTHIDGEAVNPVWGLTKSKNPRKRLPIACGWCRRKKIRCEPSGDGCLQCKKAKRPCEIEPTRRRLVRDSSFREYIVP